MGIYGRLGLVFSSGIPCDYILYIIITLGSAGNVYWFLRPLTSIDLKLCVLLLYNIIILNRWSIHCFPGCNISTNAKSVNPSFVKEGTKSAQPVGELKLFRTHTGKMD